MVNYQNADGFVSLLGMQRQAMQTLFALQQGMIDNLQSAATRQLDLLARMVAHYPPFGGAPANEPPEREQAEADAANHRRKAG